MTATLDPDDPRVGFWPRDLAAQMREWTAGMVADGGMVVRTGDPGVANAAFAQTLVQLDGDLVTKLRLTGGPGDAELIGAHLDAVGRLLRSYVHTVRRLLTWIVGSVWAVVAIVTGLVGAYWGEWRLLMGAVGSLLVAIASRWPPPVQRVVGWVVGAAPVVAAVALDRLGALWTWLIVLATTATLAVAGWLLLRFLRSTIAERIERGLKLVGV